MMQNSSHEEFPEHRELVEPHNGQSLVPTMHTNNRNQAGNGYACFVNTHHQLCSYCADREDFI